MVLSKRFSDRVFILFACVVATAAAAVERFYWRYDMPVGYMWLALALIASSVPCAFSPNRAMFSKLIEGSHHQAALSSSLSIFASLGGILGNNWVGATFGLPTEHGPVSHATTTGLLGALGFMLVCTVVNHFVCFPPSRYMPPDKKETENKKKEEERQDGTEKETALP